MSRQTTSRISTRRLLAASAVAVLAVATGTASAARGDPQKQLTPADNTRARTMFLKRSDLGPGFKSTPQSSLEPDVYCKALDESDLTLTGEAESPTFERGFVSVYSAADVYESRADATTSWRRGTSTAGERCSRDVLRREFAKEGIRLESYRRVPFPRVAERSAAYRVELSARQQGVTIRAVTDFVVLMHARAQVALLFTGLTPVPRAEQVRLARLTAERMAKAMRGA
jgi:hypothetical protein